jgi:REP element-mobilizing transposase RayT
MAFWRNYYHIVWATKNREPLIQPGFEPQIYGRIVNIGAKLDVYTFAINGWADHINIIVAIPPKHAVAYVVKNLKGASSHYVNHVIRPANLTFAWQQGYGCLTLGEKQLSSAKAYVQRQKQHHEDQVTNRWMECCEILDEGPKSTNKITDAIHSVQETEAIYEVESGDFPF